MRILVTDSTGPGAVIGKELAETGKAVTFLDHRRRAFALMHAPLHVKSDHGDYRQHAHHIEDAEIFSPYDLIVVATSAGHAAQIAEILPRAVGPETIILALVNGLEHMARIAVACPGARLLDGQHNLAVHLDEQGAVIHTGGTYRLFIGAQTPEELNTACTVTALFADTGFVVRIISDLDRRRWKRLTQLVGICGLAALMQVRVARIGEADVGHRHLWQLVQECEAVATAGGYGNDIGELAQFMEGLPHKVPVLVQAMLDDVGRGDIAEVNELVRQIHREARATCTPTPLLDVVHTALVARHGDQRPGDAIEIIEPTPTPAPTARRDGWFSSRRGVRPHGGGHQ